MTRPDFDHWLRDALHAEPEPDDAGFSLRVMAALPAREAPPRPSAPTWVRLGGAALAMAAAVIGLGALGLAVEPLDPAAWGLATASLLGLLLWWSLPQSAGSGWR